MTGACRASRFGRRGPVADVRHRPEIPGERPLLVRRRDDRYLHARAVGMQAGQLADARRHADGVGDRVRVDVGIARVRRVGHRRAPGLPPEVSGRDQQARHQRGAHCTGRGHIDERREPDPGEHDGPEVERQQVPGGLVRDGGKDRRGDGDGAREIAGPKGAFAPPGRRSGLNPRRHRADGGQHEHQPLAPLQATRRRVRRAGSGNSARAARGPPDPRRGRSRCRRPGADRGRRRGWRETTSRRAPRSPRPLPG